MRGLRPHDIQPDAALSARTIRISAAIPAEGAGLRSAAVHKGIVVKEKGFEDWDRSTVSEGIREARWSAFAIGIKFLLPVILLFGAGAYFLGWFGEAATVAREEFGPREMLRKYEWFKDASANLDKKKADIGVYEARIVGLEGDYEGTPRSEWPRSDREQLNLWRTEVAGVRASYNGLAAEYNAQMAKFNWRFANAGDLPEGATVALPREYRTYEGSGR